MASRAISRFRAGMALLIAPYAEAGLGVRLYAHRASPHLGDPCPPQASDFVARSLMLSGAAYFVIRLGAGTVNLIGCSRVVRHGLGTVLVMQPHERH
jgi:hypothetical protein